VISPCPAGGQATACAFGPVLPAYAHNDYANPHPLYDALELGFWGVEADILLRGGELRVAHDASATRPGRSLEALYLRPLRAIVRKCGHVIPRSAPFLLNVELKERSRAGYDSLIALLERYTDLFETPSADSGRQSRSSLSGGIRRWRTPPRTRGIRCGASNISRLCRQVPERSRPLRSEW
jgi:hypothetical protein